MDMGAALIHPAVTMVMVLMMRLGVIRLVMRVRGRVMAGHMLGRIMVHLNTAFRPEPDISVIWILGLAHGSI
jgi:hypothetical protein